MSYHRVNEKYRKYQNLNRQNPQNSEYARKLEKYKNLSNKLAQKGGNVNNINTNINVSTNQLQTQQGSRTNVSNTKTSDIVAKIQGVLAYSKEAAERNKAKTNAKQTGGNRKKVTGYRNMKGGVYEDTNLEKFESDDTNNVTNKLLPKIRDTRDKQDKIDGIKLIANGAVIGVGALREDNVTKDKKIADLQKEIEDLKMQSSKKTGDIESEKEAIEKDKRDLELLKTAYKGLVEEFGEDFTTIDFSGTNLNEEGLNKIRDAAKNKIRELNEKIKTSEDKLKEKEEQYTKIQSELELKRKEYADLEKDMNKYYNDEYSKLHDLMKAYEESFDNLIEVLPKKEDA